VSRTVLIVAKAPAAGRSKTRLVPPLTPLQAADIQRALLLDTLDACREEVAATGLLYAHEEEAAALAELAGPGARLILQRGRGLGDALSGAMSRLLPDGPVALVSADVPGVPQGSLRRAFETLEAGADVVLGPALDGGYWLIAMRAFHEAPFREIPWSTPAALGVTVKRCEEAGLDVQLLEPWRDVDTVVDLELLLESVDALPAERTRTLLRDLVAIGTLGGGPPVLRLRASEPLASTPWRTVVRDRLLTSAGTEVSYTYLACPRAVFVVPVTDSGEMILVRQYRHPVRDWTLEVPAGTVDDGESSIEAAQRELAEEAGGHARAWTHLSTFYSSSAHISLRSDAFLATGVELSQANPGEGEDVSVLRLPVTEAIRRARAGEFQEGQTALAILLAAERLHGGGE
jgi:rSAM/selenodomain-associated transferase 1